MISVFRNYYFAMMRPFRTHLELKHDRESFGRLWIVGEDDRCEDGLSFVESMSISWIFSVLAAIYSILFLILGHYIRSASGEDFFSDFARTAANVTLMGILFETVFFPLTSWIYVKFWSMVIKFFAGLFEVEGDIDLIADQVSNYSLVCNFFLVIPIFGSMIKYLGSLFYLFAGLRVNLGLSVAQGLTVLISPFFLIFLIFVILSIYLMIIINMI